MRMMPMFLRVRQLVDPFFQYLNQPIGKSEQNAVWSPNRFWYLYRIDLLEKCWHKKAAQKSQSTH